jgi:hypothetical protein
VVVSVVQVQDAQTMYYLANPENGKKVVSGKQLAQHGMIM